MCVCFFSPSQTVPFNNGFEASSAPVYGPQLLSILSDGLVVLVCAECRPALWQGERAPHSRGFGKIRLGLPGTEPRLLFPVHVQYFKQNPSRFRGGVVGNG